MVRTTPVIDGRKALAGELGKGSRLIPADATHGGRPVPRGSYPATRSRDRVVPSSPRTGRLPHSSQGSPRHFRRRAASILGCSITAGIDELLKLAIGDLVLSSQKPGTSTGSSLRNR